MKLRALVTGANGFTGRYFCQLLEQEGIETIPLGCDLLDIQALSAIVTDAQPDWVVHLAAKSFVAEDEALDFYRVNVLGTENLLNALSSLSKKPTRILIASSANVYGTPNLETISEEITPEPVNHYACSKLAMEHMIRTWFEKLPIVIARPFNYTGFGQDKRFLIPKIVSHFVERAPVIELGNINVSRDFSDVRDVVNSYFALLRSPFQSMTVNVCQGVATSLKEVIEMMNQLAGYEIKVQVNPAFVRANEIPMLRGDNSLLKKLIHHVPSISIQQTLKNMFDAMSS
jgi:GDP-6-deoxy-D-talose 4-dehydrogenase